MAAQLTDAFKKTGAGTVTTLAAPGKAAAAVAITVGATTNYPTDTGLVIAIRVVDSAGELVAGTYTEWSAISTSGTTFTIDPVPVYGSDQVYAAGSTTQVYIPLSSYAHNELIDGILTEHNQDGTHSAVTADSVTVATGKITTTAVSKLEDAATPLSTYRDEYSFDFVASGCVWSGDAYASTRNASMTAGVVYINGRRIAISAVTARSFTASKDVYVDILDNADGTGTLVYTDNTTNAASPALAANSIRIAIIVVGATNIAAATSVNQGQETMVVPIASSVAYSVSDSLGNLICNRNPTGSFLGHGRRTTDFSTATTGSWVDVTGVQTTVQVPTGRKLKLTFMARSIDIVGAGNNAQISIRESTTVMGSQLFLMNGTQSPIGFSVITSPTAGTHTYKASIQGSTGTSNVYAANTSGITIFAELV